MLKSKVIFIRCQFLQRRPWPSRQRQQSRNIATGNTARHSDSADTTPNSGKNRHGAGGVQPGKCLPSRRSARLTRRDAFTRVRTRPKSIGLYNPGNTSGAQYMKASSSRPNGGYPSMNGGVYRNPGSSSQGIGSSSQGAGSSSQGAGTSSRNTNSSSASGYQSSETRYICVVAGMGYCGFNGRPNISSGSRCHCGEASGLTR